MLLILGIDVIVLATLLTVISRRGLEQGLPYFVFFVTLLPEECRIKLPGLFDLYTRRLALIVIALAFLTTAKRHAVRTVPLKKLILVHITWVVLSTLASIVFITSVKQLVAQVCEYYLVYYICVETISETVTISKMGFAMIAAVSVACVAAVFEIYGGASVLSLFPSELQQTYGTGDALYVELMDRGIRARGTFPHPILFGGAIAMVLPMVVYFVSTHKERLVKLSLSFALVLLAWALYKTSSRGPWLATGVSMGMLLLGSSARVRKRLLTVAALGVVILIARPGITSTLWNTYLATLNPDTQMGASFEYRPVLYRTVTHTLAEDPVRALLGFGLGSFRDKGLVLILPHIETHRWYTCDSAWALLMYETGFVGVALIATLFFRCGGIAIRGWRTLRRPDGTFSLVCLCSLLAFFIVMASVAIYGWGQNGYMLWMLIGMTVSYTAVKKKEETARSLPIRKLEAATAPWWQ